MYSIIKYLTICCICFAPSLVSAEFMLYSLDGVYSAPFPAEPIFNGEIGSGKGKHRSYKYYDNNKMIIYYATYQVNKHKFNSSVLDEAIKNYVKGISLGTKADLIEFDYFVHNNNKAAKYVLKFSNNDPEALRYGVVIYKDGKFHGWSVTEYVGNSLQSAKNLFDHYQGYIEIR